jgi:hypothetical protein
MPRWRLINFNRFYNFENGTHFYTADLAEFGERLLQLEAHLQL